MGLPPADEEAFTSATPSTSLGLPAADRPRSSISSNLGQGEGVSSRSHSRASTHKSLHNHSIFASIADNDHFQHFTLFIIVVNALWIGVDTEWNHKVLVKDNGDYPLEPSSIVVENLFCVYFTAEVLIRFFAFRSKCSFWRDAWFVFDSLLVTCMVIETWIIAVIELASGSSGGASFLSNFSALRLLRLLRLTRMARLMRSVPELMTLVKGMAAATMAVFWMLLLLVIVMYVFAIVFTSTVGDPEKNNDEELDPETCEFMFGTMGDAMMSLFTHGVLGDNLSATVGAILAFPDGKGGAQGYFLFWFFMLFFGISSMTLLNMLLGVLCEVITQTADQEKDSTQVRELRLCIEDAFDLIDINEDGRVCEAEWSQIKANPVVRSQLAALGVEASHMDERLDQMQATIFDKKRVATGDRQDGLTLEDLIQKVIEIRPDKPVTALDLEILKAKVENRDSTFSARLSHVESLISKMLAKRGTPIAATSQVSAINAEAHASPPPPGSGSALGQIPTQLLFKEMKSRAQNATGRGPQ